MKGQPRAPEPGRAVDKLVVEGAGVGMLVEGAVGMLVVTVVVLVAGNGVDFVVLAQGSIGVVVRPMNYLV